MTRFGSAARRLPPHHITIRVPWHDGGWTGTVCTRPLDNTSCLTLPRIGGGRRDDVEARHGGQRLDKLKRADLPPCVGERVAFMAPFPLTRTMTHPYMEFYPESHGHFAPTRFVQPPFSAACVPFRWMLREKIEGNAQYGEIGIAERLKIAWESDREPDIRNRDGKEVETDWVQERENQLALLDTFFSALQPAESLCFFYAKRTPLSEQSRRVIVGVGRVLSVGEATEYAYKGSNPPLRCVLWERNVKHSVRPGFGWHKVATAVWWGGDVDSVSAAVTRTDNFIDETPTVATWKYAAPERLASIEYAKAAEMPLRTRYYPADEFMEVVGSRGILWVTRCTGEMLDMPPLVLHTGSETVSYQLPMDWIESFNGAARDFTDGILTDRQPMMDIEFTEDVLRIILAMYRASDTRSWVAPSEVG